MNNTPFPWKIVLGAMAILGGAQGVVINTNGIILAEIVREMGFRAGDFSVFYTIMYLVSALCMPHTSKAFFAVKRPRAFMSLMGTLFTLPFAGMCVYTKLWHWYAAAAFAGMGYSCMMVSVTTVLNSWFAAKRGLVAGVTLSVTGLIGAVLAPVFARCVAAFGWRVTSLCTATAAFVMIAVLGAFALVPSPDREGRAPWGTSPDTARAVPQTARRVPLYVFFLCMAAFAGLNAMFQFNLQLPLFARSHGYTLAAGAVLTSCSMIGNIAGKVLLGYAIDRLGAYRAGTLLALALFSSFAVFRFCPGTFAALCAAGVLFGSVYSVGGVLVPQMSLAVWGQAEYRACVSRFSAVDAFAAALSGSAFPYLFDLTGSWSPMLLWNMAVAAAAAGLFAYIGRQEKNWHA